VIANPSADGGDGTAPVDRPDGGGAGKTGCGDGTTPSRNGFVAPRRRGDYTLSPIRYANGTKSFDIRTVVPALFPLSAHPRRRPVPADAWIPARPASGGRIRNAGGARLQPAPAHGRAGAAG